MTPGVAEIVEEGKTDSETVALRTESPIIEKSKSEASIIASEFENMLQLLVPEWLVVRERGQAITYWCELLLVTGTQEYRYRYVLSLLARLTLRHSFGVHEMMRRIVLTHTANGTMNHNSKWYTTLRHVQPSALCPAHLVDNDQLRHLPRALLPSSPKVTTTGSVM